MQSDEDGVDLMGYTSWGCIDLVSKVQMTNVINVMDLFMLDADDN